jgi:hypothetical protein
MENEFSVYQFFPNETYEEVLRFVNVPTAMDAVMKLTRSVGAKLGTTQRVIVTDGGDCCVFEWKHGEGVTFPPGVTLPHERKAS